MDDRQKSQIKLLLARGLKAQESLARRRAKSGKWRASEAAMTIAEFRRAYDAALALLDGGAGSGSTTQLG